MKITLLLVFLLIISPTKAQFLTGRATLEFQPPSDSPAWTSPVEVVPLSEVAPFLSFFIVWEGQGEGFEVRFSGDGKDWSPWLVVRRDLHNPDLRITEPFFTAPDRRHVQLRYREMTVRRITCHFYSPGKTPPPKETTRPGPAEDCALPPYRDRAAWCPDNNCPPAASPSFTQVSHLIVHHSAGTNEADDWAAVVRAIWDLHVNGNGWSDIGYNFLIDPDGGVYEGRGDDILGAHFCGANSGTMGVCVLGNFQSRPPTEAAVSSLADLLAWKAFDRDIDPLGKSFHASSGLDLFHLSGHRDGCATACPGDQFYPMLPDLRLQVDDLVAICKGLTSIDKRAGDEGEPRSNFRLSPNPVHSTLGLELESPEKERLLIEIISVDGRRQALFLREKPAGRVNLQLPLPELAAGYYLARLVVGGQYTCISFVKN